MINPKITKVTINMLKIADWLAGNLIGYLPGCLNNFPPMRLPEPDSPPARPPACPNFIADCS